MEVTVFVRYRDKYVYLFGESGILKMQLNEYEDLKSAILSGDIIGDWWEITSKEVQLIKPKPDFEPAY